MLLNLAEFHRPDDLGEAVALLRRPGLRTEVLAGGTELAGRNDEKLRAVVDLSRLSLGGISVQENRLVIGAMTPLGDLESNEAVGQLAGGLLIRASRQGAPATIRAAATLGGTLAGQKGGHELPSVLLALDATVTLATPEPLAVPIIRFFAERERLLNGAIITAVSVPLWRGAGGGFAHVARSPSDRAIVCAAAVSYREFFRVGLGGVSALPGLVTQLPARVSHWDAPDDFLGSADYRRQVGPVLAERAVAEARGGISE